MLNPEGLGFGVYTLGFRVQGMHLVAKFFRASA